MEKFLIAMEENPDGAYDYIGKHYHEMSNFDLRTILLEYIYGVHQKISEREIIENLQENYSD